LWKNTVVCEFALYEWGHVRPSLFICRWGLVAHIGIGGGVVGDGKEITNHEICDI
jgi:hypothetical protein